MRNRFKRRVRAWFRERRELFPEGTDLVVIARASGARLPFAELDRRLCDLLDLHASESSDVREGSRR